MYFAEQTHALGRRCANVYVRVYLCASVCVCACVCAEIVLPMSMVHAMCIRVSVTQCRWRTATDTYETISPEYGSVKSV